MRGGDERRGAAPQEIESTLQQRPGESERSMCVQMFRWRPRDGCWCCYYQLINIWAVNLSATTNAALDGAARSCTTTRTFFWDYKSLIKRSDCSYSCKIITLLPYYCN